MNIAKTKKLTFQEYLDFCETSQERYELVRGELRLMTPPAWLHYRIAKFLERVLDEEITRLQLPWEAFRDPGQQTEENTSRLPDVAIVPVEVTEVYLDRPAILTTAAILIVEVVSDSTALQDYREKVEEYQNKGIREYWIADPDPFGAAKYIGSPKRPTVSVYSLVDGVYQVKRFQGSDRILSPTFPALELTAEEILRAGR
ncbi:Uma2 family endonuclease [Leptolyngbya sp. AN03gr2]|uniref:Uma2 family endonuclease n=1 Tax=unclassified Leptolyngbya TaxID=2650499 RepID=UPI003D30F3CF